MFLGIGRYRTWFTLGSWAEPALGCYIGGIILARPPVISVLPLVSKGWWILLAHVVPSWHACLTHTHPGNVNHKGMGSLGQLAVAR